MVHFSQNCLKFTGVQNGPTFWEKSLKMGAFSCQNDA